MLLRPRFFRVSAIDFHKTDAAVIDLITPNQWVYLEAGLDFLANKAKNLGDKFYQSFSDLQKSGLWQIGDVVQLSKERLVDEFGLSAKCVPFYESRARAMGLRLDMYLGAHQTYFYRTNIELRGWQY